MDQYGIIDIEKIDYSLITIGEIRGIQQSKGQDNKATNAGDGIKTARILYDGQKFTVRLGKYPTPWGLSPPMKKEGASQFRLDLSLGRTPEEDPVFKLGQYVDGLVKKLAQDNTKDMLNRKTFSDDIFEERFRGPSIRWSRDPATRELRDYPPSLRITVPVDPYNPNKFQVDGFFTPSRQVMDVNINNANNQISRNDQVRCLVTFDRVWVNAIGFGVKIKLVQCRVYKAPMRLDVDMTGGDMDIDAIEEAYMPHADVDVMGEDESEEVRANNSLAGMRRQVAVA